MQFLKDIHCDDSGRGMYGNRGEALAFELGGTQLEESHLELPSAQGSNVRLGRYLTPRFIPASSSKNISVVRESQT